MIVMKFGGTSVESAAAIERVAGIVRTPRSASARWWSSPPWARPPTSCSPSPTPPSRASATTTSSSSTTCAISIRARRAWWCRSTERAELDRTLDDHFQELTELVKGLAVLGELTPRSIDAISSYGERLSSYIVTLAFRHFGMNAVHVDSRQVIVTDRRHTQAAPQFPRDLRAPGGDDPAAGAKTASW